MNNEQEEMIKILSGIKELNINEKMKLKEIFFANLGVDSDKYILQKDEKFVLDSK